ncbi:glycosyltransferase family 87 protein [Halorarius halobius]|uniref:glycosyltransferase family 87 protein n=1 Tax=Halorarius halobius TaxID=2962671 RepID=UPI0020CBBAE3|nr:glycosyltransferase family 87 protein [Halorarius halobius]
MSLRRQFRAFADGDERLASLGWLTLSALLAFPFLALVVQADGGPFRFGGVDFKAYYLAGLRARAGLPLYESGQFVERVTRPRATEFLYPPAAAVPFAAVTRLPPVSARWLWTVGQVLFLWWSVLKLAGSFGLSLSRGQRALAALVVVGFQPVFFLTRIGNVSGFMAGMFCLSAAVTVAPEGPERPYLGGAAAALAAAVKPFAAPAGAHLVGDRRRLVGATAAVAGLLAVGVAAFGADAHGAYLEVLLAGDDSAGGDPSALPFHARPYYRFPGVATVLRGSLLGVAVGASAVAARVGADARAFALGAVSIPLVAPGANTLTLVLAGPGLVVALATEWRASGRPGVVLGSILAVQVSVYLVRIVGIYGPMSHPGLPWGLVQHVLVVQPATLGLLAVFSLCVARVLARSRDV